MDDSAEADALPESTPTPSRDTVDIHKPHPWHGWREFLKEYGIIVLGVLTALAGEQAVEHLHDRAQVAEARAAIKGEMQLALQTMRSRTAMSPCVVRRSDELRAWADSYRAGKPLTPRLRVGRVIPSWPTLQVWETFRSSPGSTHMDTKERLAIATFYANLDVIRGVDEIDRSIWLQLQDFDGAPVLDGPSQMRLRGLAAQAEQVNASYNNLAQLAADRAKSLGVTVGPLTTGETDERQKFPLLEGLCQPLFADRGAPGA
jgi:hypothetical protein